MKPHLHRHQITFNLNKQKKHLLEKIEELTLYIIDLQKQIDELKK